MGIRIPAGPALAVGIALVAFGYMYYQLKGSGGETTNYAISYDVPKGWDPVPHGPQTLFLYKHPKTGLLLRGAQNQVVSDVNPTPELDSRGMAQYYIDRTKENLPDWKAELAGEVAADGVKFNLIRRSRNGKTVVTAFGVRGNTTLIVSLSGADDEQKSIDSGGMDFLREYVGQVSFAKADPLKRSPTASIPAIMR